jgi:hypothetical protein
MATPNKTKVKRPTYVPFAVRNGMPVALPLFGPASLTREAAQERLDKALASGNYASGEVREVSK